MTYSTAAGEDRWQRLGALLIQRRTALDPRYHNRTTFAEVTGLNYRVIYDIEEARRTNFGNSTVAAIEVAYRLEPGAIRRFLGGGELGQQPQPQASAEVIPLPVDPDDPVRKALAVQRILGVMISPDDAGAQEMLRQPLPAEQIAVMISMLFKYRKQAASGEPGTGRQRR